MQEPATACGSDSQPRNPRAGAQARTAGQGMMKALSDVCQPKAGAEVSKQQKQEVKHLGACLLCPLLLKAAQQLLLSLAEGKGWDQKKLFSCSLLRAPYMVHRCLFIMTLMESYKIWKKSLNNWVFCIKITNDNLVTKMFVPDNEFISVT